MNQQTVDYGIYDDSTSMRLLQVGKVTISAISSDPLCNDSNAGFKIVLLKPICLICKCERFCRRNTQVTFVEKPQLKIINFKNYKH